jgi:hypothetical protein
LGLLVFLDGAAFDCVQNAIAPLAHSPPSLSASDLMVAACPAKLAARDLLPFIRRQLYFEQTHLHLEQKMLERPFSKSWFM